MPKKVNIKYLVWLQSKKKSASESTALSLILFPERAVHLSVLKLVVLEQVCGLLLQPLESESAKKKISETILHRITQIYYTSIYTYIHINTYEYIINYSVKRTIIIIIQTYYIYMPRNILKHNEKGYRISLTKTTRTNYR